MIFTVAQKLNAGDLLLVLDIARANIADITRFRGHLQTQDSSVN